MAAFTTPLKPFSLFVICVTFIGTLAAVAASLHQAQPAGVSAPAAQAVPVAPAAALFQRPASSASALSAVPQPAPVPAAPSLPLAEIPHQADQALSVPAAGRLPPLLVLAVAGGLLAALTVTWRRASPNLRTAAC